MGNIIPSVTGAEHVGPQQTGDNVEAKRVVNYVWNGSSWQRHTGDSITYAVRIDDTTTADTVYIGKAVIGSATSAAVWQIQKLATASGLIKTWADGNSNFDNVFDDITTITYS